ncbi:MAG: FISUMP domain-containing protein [Candidatus Gracilibacteria bacterium]|nr:FISUMP domain-containing protein [Candidatus Gracilibacteria bacterium]
MKNKQAFTLIELVIVLVILSILGLIAFFTLSGYSTSARDSARISDISRMRTVIELFNVEGGKYPLPTNFVEVTYSGATVWNQGIFGETMKVNTNKLDRIPVDPISESYYTYSLTKKGNEFELGGIMEGNDITQNYLNYNKANAGTLEARAYVTGNYNQMFIKSVIDGITCELLSVPSIITNDINITELPEIINNNSLVYSGFKNLPSSYRKSKFNGFGGFRFSPNKLVVYSDTSACNELYQCTTENINANMDLLQGMQDAYIGTILGEQGNIKNIVEVEINKNNPSIEATAAVINILNTTFGCKIVLNKTTTTPLCGAKPNYSNAIFIDGNPSVINQARQSSNQNTPCYWTCGLGNVLQGESCLNSNCLGTVPNGTNEISNATDTTGGTWNYNTTPGTCTFTCNTGYYRSGGDCLPNQYTVSGSFGTGGSGATINVCGTTTTANSSGNFSITSTHGTICSNITATRTGYDCYTTQDGTVSLGGNTTNIGGSCTIKTYSVTGNFGVAGATVNVCGTNVVTNSIGGFFISLNHGLNCSNITATKTGYNCSTTTQGPSSLTSNITNIAGTCDTIMYNVSGNYGTNGSNATINVCGINTTTDGNGYFSVSRANLSVCNNISITKAGYGCSTTTQGPASLTSNVSNIAGSCNVNAYTVSGSFGSNANGAIINVCGTNVTANSLGNFSTSKSYGSVCDNITATRTGYTCTTTTNGPSELSSSVTNIAGTCSLNTYQVSGSFGAGAAGASINVCGISVIADGNGDFTATRNYGATCNNITASRTGYTCSTTTNGPLNLTTNVTNIAGTCNINSYTVSGTFGANANGATISVCGTNITANSSGAFSTTRTYGTVCNNITASRPGYTCTTTTNGPASLASNTTNIAGSCSVATYTVSGSFGANGAGAYVSVCGLKVFADGSGNFSVTRSHGTVCNNVSALTPGHSCTVSVQGPASLTSNISNIAGTCTYVSGWNNISGTNCDIPDMRIGNQVWAGCNSILGTGMEWGNQTNGTNGTVGTCYPTYNGTSNFPGSCAIDSTPMASTTKANTWYTGTTSYGDTENPGIWGKLYTWANAAGACPSGRHLPTDAEWETLETNLNGGSNCRNATNGMLCSGLGWRGQNSKHNYNNVANFLNIVMAGEKTDNSFTFYDRGSNSYFWSATAFDTNQSYGRRFTWASTSIDRSYYLKTYGFSVRCIKN